MTIKLFLDVFSKSIVFVYIELGTHNIRNGIQNAVDIKLRTFCPNLFCTINFILNTYLFAGDYPDIKAAYLHPASWDFPGIINSFQFGGVGW